jgi:exodeoxyribonuclease VII small subunit
MAENTQVDVKKLSFERAIEELESIVKRLEDGKVPLEESVAIYERGEALKRRCEELLRQAEARVDKITTDANGQVDRDRAARRAMIPAGRNAQMPSSLPATGRI